MQKPGVVILTWVTYSYDLKYLHLMHDCAVPEA
jgi:hypothetical protein